MILKSEIVGTEQLANGDTLDGLITDKLFSASGSKESVYVALRTPIEKTGDLAIEPGFWAKTIAKILAFLTN